MSLNIYWRSLSTPANINTGEKSFTHTLYNTVFHDLSYHQSYLNNHMWKCNLHTTAIYLIWSHSHIYWVIGSYLVRVISEPIHLEMHSSTWYVKDIANLVGSNCHETNHAMIFFWRRTVNFISNITSCLGLQKNEPHIFHAIQNMGGLHVIYAADKMIKTGQSISQLTVQHP